MRWACAILVGLLVATCGNTAKSVAAAQDPAGQTRSPQESTNKSQLASLRVRLRLHDENPFLGVATVRLVPENGYDLLGAWDATKGEMTFYAVGAGTYIVQVTAPGFQTAQFNTVMERNIQERTLVVVMEPRGAPTAATATPTVTTTEVKLPPSVEVAGSDTPRVGTARAAEETAGTANGWPDAKKPRWKPAGWDDGELPPDRSVACPTEQILHSTGERVKEFIASSEKFTATENVDHYTITKNEERRNPEHRKFIYVAMVSRDRYGGIMIEEYRDGGLDMKAFPANLATLGLPITVLIFHPEYAKDFDFACDGLVRRNGHEYWQMQFAQREDRPERISGYVVNGTEYPEYLKGRAWIDPGRGQVVELETELEKPIPQIGVWEQWVRIRYTAVKFASTGQEIWLPQSAELYGDRRGRYYRRHSFQDFKLFSVETSEQVKVPKGSYRFTNLTDTDIAGEFTVLPVGGLKGGPLTLRFTLPARQSVVKIVGVGKDVNIPPAEIGSARFVHNGTMDSVKVEVNLVQETTLDVVPRDAQAEP